MYISTSSIIGFIFIFLIIFLQVVLSRKENKLYGLILPFIVLVSSIIFAIGFTPASIEMETSTTTTSEEGVVLDTSSTSETLPIDNAEVMSSMISTFLAMNFWTLILLIVYAICRATRNNNVNLPKIEKSKL